MISEDRLQTWLDGELSPAEEAEVRAALADSPSLQAALDARLQLDAHVSAVREQGGEVPAVAPAPWTRRRALVGVALAAGLAGLAMLTPALVRMVRGPSPVETYVARLDTRLTAVRPSHPGADAYRPYAPFLGPDLRTRTPPADLLAELERSGDRRGLAAVYLLDGRVEMAAHYVAPEGDSADDLSDAGALLYLRGDYAAALDRLEAATARDSDHAAAWWNLGLTREAMGEGEAAIEAYRRSAARSSPAWAEAAERRIAALSR